MKTHPAPAGSRGHAAPSRVTADAAPACLTGPTWLHGITAEDGLQDKRSEARLDSGRVRYRCCVTPVPAHGRPPCGRAQEMTCSGGRDHNLAWPCSF